MMELLVVLHSPRHIWQYPLGLQLVKMSSQYGTCTTPTIMKAVKRVSACLVQIMVYYDGREGNEEMEMVCCPGHEDIFLQHVYQTHLFNDSLPPLKFQV